MLDAEIAFVGVFARYGICCIGSAEYHAVSKFSGISFGVQEVGDWIGDGCGFVERLSGGWGRAGELFA